MASGGAPTCTESFQHVSHFQSKKIELQHLSNTWAGISAEYLSNIWAEIYLHLM